MASEATIDKAPSVGAVWSTPAVSAHAAGGGFQLRYVVRLCLAVACGAAAATAVAYVLLSRELAGYAENMTILSAVRQRVVSAVVLSALLHPVLTGGIAALLALFACHKIAGPTVRLVRMLGRVAPGRLPGTVRFRRGDQVGTLEGHFNAVSQSLRERHEALRRGLAAVRSAAEQLRRALQRPEAHEERRAAARQLRERADELARLLAHIGGGVETEASD